MLRYIDVRQFRLASRLGARDSVVASNQVATKEGLSLAPTTQERGENMTEAELKKIFEKAEARERQFQKMEDAQDIHHDDLQWFSDQQGHREAK